MFVTEMITDQKTDLFNGDKRSHIVIFIIYNSYHHNYIFTCQLDIVNKDIHINVNSEENSNM